MIVEHLINLTHRLMLFSRITLVKAEYSVLHGKYHLALHCGRFRKTLWMINVTVEASLIAVASGTLESQV